MNLFELLIPLILIPIFCLTRRNAIDKIKGEPLLAEDALVHDKSDHVNRYTSLYIIHFYIAARDTVVNCEVSREIWMRLEKKQRGILCHQGGQFYSFECNGELICEETTPPKLSF